MHYSRLSRCNCRVGGVLFLKQLSTSSIERRRILFEFSGSYETHSQLWTSFNSKTHPTNHHTCITFDELESSRNPPL